MSLQPVFCEWCEDSWRLHPENLWINSILEGRRLMETAGEQRVEILGPWAGLG